MRVTVRPARQEEIPFLQAHADRQLPPGCEPIELRKRTVYLVEDEGVIAGVGAAGLEWQIEPLILMPEFERYAPESAKRRATYLLAKALVSAVGGAPFYAHLNDPRFEALATKFGMWRAHEAGAIYRGGHA